LINAKNVCKWTARMVPLGSLALAILYILSVFSRHILLVWECTTSTSLMKNCSMVKKILSEKRFITFFLFSKLISVNLSKKKAF
jgi:hypothetical protein